MKMNVEVTNVADGWYQNQADSSHDQMFYHLTLQKKKEKGEIIKQVHDYV
jgi:hypothetical protein